MFKKVNRVLIFLSKALFNKSLFITTICLLCASVLNIIYNRALGIWVVVIWVLLPVLHIAVSLWKQHIRNRQAEKSRNEEI